MRIRNDTSILMLWRTSILVILGIINVVLFYRMLWGESGILAYSELRKQYTAMLQELALIDRTNVRLSKEIRLLKSDEAYVEKMIRQRLHYVRDNEILYLFTDDGQGRTQGEKDARQD